MNGWKRAAALAAVAWMGVAGAPGGARADAAFDVGTLRVERHGERGNPVILVPGLASGSWVWQDTIAALQRDHRVYAVTLAGFDGRPPAGGDVLARAVDSLRQLIDAQGLERPVLVGHSLGGTLGLLFAARYPERVGGVVAVDGLPVFPTTETVPASERPALAGRVHAQFAAATQAEFEAQQAQYMRRVGVVDAQRAADVAKRTSRSDPRAVADYAAAVMALDLRATLPAIRVPVLEIAPYFADDWAPRGVSEAGLRAYYASLLHGVPDVEVVTIGPARHFVMLDQPEAFADALRRYLAAHARR